MSRAFFVSALLLTFSTGALLSQNAGAPAASPTAGDEDFMREELGVNEITEPSIQQILSDFDTFRPICFDIIQQNDLNISFNNRFQTALHFGSLVADGFMLTVAERPEGVENIGRSLIREASALGVGERLTRRSKSLFELSEKRDWMAMRQELVRTQTDVEKTMIELRDEELAHVISLGGWIRGFQLAANSCARNYTPDHSRILIQPDIMDYYLDRLDTLHPRLRKTELVTTLISKLKEIRSVAAGASGHIPSQKDVEHLRDLANEAEAAAMTPVDDEGNFQKAKPKQ